MDTPTIVLSLILTTVSSLYWGRLLSDKLPDFDSRFDRKPFNCRPCLTFHLAWLQASFIAFITQSAILFVLGIIVAFVLFIIVKYSDNQKIEK